MGTKGNKMSTIADIHSYTIFANIDKRDGNIDGHQLILSKETMNAIEDLILKDGKMAVMQEVAYKVKGDE